MKTPVRSNVTLSNKNYLAEAQTRNHVTIIDLPKEDGADDTAPTPKEYLLTAIGSCVAITIRMYAEHKGWDLGKVTVNMEIVETKTPKGIQKHIVEVISFEKEITENQHKRLLNIAGKCPVAKMVKGETAFETSIL